MVATGPGGGEGEAGNENEEDGDEDIFTLDEDIPFAFDTAPSEPRGEVSEMTSYHPQRHYPIPYPPFSISHSLFPIPNPLSPPQSHQHVFIFLQR